MQDLKDLVRPDGGRKLYGGDSPTNQLSPCASSRSISASVGLAERRMSGSLSRGMPSPNLNYIPSGETGLDHTVDSSVPSDDYEEMCVTPGREMMKDIGNKDFVDDTTSAATSNAGASTSARPLPIKTGFLEEVFGDKANAFSLRDTEFDTIEPFFVFETDIDPHGGGMTSIRFQSPYAKVLVALQYFSGVFALTYFSFVSGFRMHYPWVYSVGGIQFEVALDLMCLFMTYIEVFHVSLCDVLAGKEVCDRVQVRHRWYRRRSFRWKMLGAIFPWLSVYLYLFKKHEEDTNTTLEGNIIFFVLDIFFVILKLGRCHVLTYTPAVFLSLDYNFRFCAARLYTTVILFGHIMACVWHLSIFHCNDIDRMIAMHIPAPEDRTLLSWYFTSLRDGLYMVTAQDRQYLAKDGEYIMLCIIGPTAAFFFAYVFGNTTVLVQRSLALQTQHSSHMSFIRSAMESLGLPVELQERIISYHDYLHVHHNPTSYDALFTGLSVNLLIELKLFLFRQLFMEKKSFFRHCHPDLIQKIVIGLKECTYSPGDIIILKGWIGDSMFFIVKGKCEVLNEHNVPIALLKSGDHFGEIALVFEQERNATVRAATYCVLGNLAKTDFDGIMVDYPDERDRLCNIASQRIQKLQSKKDTRPMEIHMPVLKSKSPVHSGERSDSKDSSALQSQRDSKGNIDPILAINSFKKGSKQGFLEATSLRCNLFGGVKNTLAGKAAYGVSNNPQSDNKRAQDPPVKKNISLAPLEERKAPKKQNVPKTAAGAPLPHSSRSTTPTSLHDGEKLSHTSREKGKIISTLAYPTHAPVMGFGYAHQIQGIGEADFAMAVAVSLDDIRANMDKILQKIDPNSQLDESSTEKRSSSKLDGSPRETSNPSPPRRSLNHQEVARVLDRMAPISNHSSSWFFGKSKSME